MSSSSSSKASWQSAFEEEPIIDCRWGCVVVALVELKPEDEELLKIFNHNIASGKFPLVQTINMADVMSAVKTDRSSGENKKKPDPKKKLTEKVKEVPKTDSSQSILPRFPQVLPMVAKYATFSEGQCKMPPSYMAYLLKYFILNIKDKDIAQKKINYAEKRSKKEEVIREEIFKTGQLKIEKPVIDKTTWRRESFDILEGVPPHQGPFNGPDMYIVLTEFYDPLYFSELQRLKVPFRAVIKIEDYVPFSGKPVSGKKADLIDSFWKCLEKSICDAETTALFKDTALLKYVVPGFKSENTPEQISTAIMNDIIAVLYSVFHLHRLHQTYMQEIQVNRMIESLEPLALSQCDVYNDLCNRLITNDANIEVFILFSIIEQIVAGVPRTAAREVPYTTEPSDLFEADGPVEDRHDGTNAPSTEPEENIKYDVNDVHGPRYPSLPIVCFHDDLVSITTWNLDRTILTPEVMFKRFIINSVLSKLKRKFPLLTKEERTKNDFQFFRLWERSKDKEEVFRVKMHFSVAMRLIERTRIFEEGCNDMSSSEVLTEESVDTDKNQTHSEETTDRGPQPKSSIFQDPIDIFYKKREIDDHDAEEKSEQTKITFKVRKAEAISELGGEQSDSYENLEVACGRCPRVAPDEESMRLNTEHIEELLESCEISFVNEPNLLVKQEDFDALLRKHHFYETFEPNRTVQILQRMYNTYNTQEYTYFSPTDALFVVGHNDADFRGVYNLQQKGSLYSPLALRDFLTYFLPRKQRWLREKESEYISFLESVREQKLAEEKRMYHEIKCRLLKHLSEGKEFQDAPDVLKELPIKRRMPPPKKGRFKAVNFKNTQTQVNVTKSEFHSDDGSVVGVKTYSWVYGTINVTANIRRMGSTLFLHNWNDANGPQRSFHIRDPLDILTTFGTDPFRCKITWPNGLIIEPIRKYNTLYIKQSHTSGGGDANERFRCFLTNGQIIIFRGDGLAEILCSGGAKYEVNKGKVEKYLAPTGEIWQRDDCSKCVHVTKTMTVLLGVDPDLSEIFYQREDSTTCMLWPDGKLVTLYSDGTKVTSVPVFGGDIFLEGSQVNRDQSKVKITFVGDTITDDCFVSITCSYLLEHPKYATVYVSGTETELRMPEKTKMNIGETYRIESHHSVLEVTPDVAEFYHKCRRCGKKSISTIPLKPEEGTLCRTKDLYDKCFTVYGSGKILYKAARDDGDAGEDDVEIPSNQICKHWKECKPLVKCLVVERDLTSTEFISDTTLSRYVGTLSEDTYFNLFDMNKDSSGQHGFFNPVYSTDKMSMSYEENDAYPTRIRRKHMQSSRECGVRPFERRFSEYINTPKKIPKLIVARFIKVLLPDPKTVMDEITTAITIHRKRAYNIYESYIKRGKSTKRTPFAKYVDKELQLIASRMCRSLELYPHTCTIIPTTELDIHSIGHKLNLNQQMVEENPADLQVNIFPDCKWISKPLKHHGKDADIPETVATDH